MKLTFVILFCINFANHLCAAVGDTLKIKTHQNVTIVTNPAVGNTNYSGWGKFPTNPNSYNKMYAQLQFECAPGKKCGEWDYLNFIKIGKRRGKFFDTLNWEIARFITPYGNYWTSAGKWKFYWTYDLTDFIPLLQDSIEIIYTHTGYESNTDRGWLINLTFNFIEGTPTRPILQSNNLYNILSVPYGIASKPITNYLKEKSVLTANGAVMGNIKIIQTGHGMDGQENCAEFCNKKRTTFHNGTAIETKQVWRDDCGMNALFPQAGTWLYDRANWCPGDKVNPENINIALPKTINQNINFEMEPYTNTSTGQGNYVFTSYFLQYADYSFNTDAAIDDIIAPTNNPQYGRYNPNCGWPIIQISNQGKQTLQKIKFRYGLKNKEKVEYTWEGQLKSLEQSTITLKNAINWSGNSTEFEVEIITVNDIADENKVNNTMRSTIMPVPVLSSTNIYLYLKTNEAASENYYTLKEINKDSIISKKNNFANNTIYRDTFKLRNGVCYELQFNDDGNPPSNNPLNKDGLSWWANTNDGNGNLYLRRTDNNSIIKNFATDFGTKIIYHFAVGFSLDQKNIEKNEIQIIPNPTQGKIEIEGHPEIRILNIHGQKMTDFEMIQNLNSTSINIENYPNGIYWIYLNQEGKTYIQKIIKY